MFITLKATALVPDRFDYRYSLLSLPGSSAPSTHNYDLALVVGIDSSIPFVRHGALQRLGKCSEYAL